MSIKFCNGKIKKLFFVGFIFISLFLVTGQTFATAPVVINRNSIYTRSKYVTLKFGPSIVGYTPVKMMITNGSGKWTSWKPYIARYTWNLAYAGYGGTSGDGTKTVSVRFREADGTTSSIYKDTIIYDRTAPKASIVVNKNNQETYTRKVTLSLASSDSVSGVRFAKIYQNRAKRWTSWISFTRSKKDYNWDLLNPTYGGSSEKASKCIYVKFRDRAGNISEPKRDCIVFSARKYIEIDLSSQYMSIYRGGTRIGKYRISSGRAGMATPTGTFKILRKIRLAWSSKYGLYMPYSLNFLGDYFIHELPYWPGGYREGAWHLGIPVSHGCVRLGIGPASKVYNFATIGMPVKIHK
jgi:lipoprotein-anchoring transpeptidase ErfK/SrfK